MKNIFFATKRVRRVRASYVLAQKRSNQLIKRSIYSLIVLVLLAGCYPFMPFNQPAPTPMATVSPTILIPPTKTLTPLPTFTPTPIGYYPPLPSTHAIDIENVSQLQELSRWGLGSIRDAVYSPDGLVVAVASIGIYLYSSDKLELIDFFPSETFITSLSFSSDGKLIAGGGEDHKVYIWNVEDQSLYRVLEGHSHRLTSLSFSPDGSMLISGGIDKMALVWDVQQGEVISKVRHSDFVLAVAFSPSSDYVASGDSTGLFRLWDPNDGESVFIGRKDFYINSIAFSFDGNLIALAGHKFIPEFTGSRIYVFNVKDGREISAIANRTLMFLDIDISFNGTMLYVLANNWIGSGGEIQVYDIETEKLLRSEKYLQGSRMGSANFSPDGMTYLAVDIAKNAVEFYDSIDLTLLDQKINHVPSMASIAISPDGQFLVSGGGDGNIYKWDIVEGKVQLVLEGHKESITSVAISPNGDLIASGSYDGTVRLWQLGDGTHVRTLNANTGYVPVVAFSPNGDLLAAGTDNGVIRLWRVNAGSHVGNLRKPGNPPGIYSARDSTVRDVTFSPDGHFLAAAYSCGCSPGDNSATVWQINNREILKNFYDNSLGMGGVAFSPDGVSLVAHGGGGLTIFRDFQNSSRYSVLTSQYIYSRLTFSLDSQLVFAGGDDGVGIWKVEDGQKIHVLPTNWIVSDIVFSRDGSLIFTTGLDGLIRIWGVPK